MCVLLRQESTMALSREILETAIHCAYCGPVAWARTTSVVPKHYHMRDVEEAIHKALARPCPKMPGAEANVALAYAAKALGDLSSMSCGDDMRDYAREALRKVMGVGE